MLDRKPRVIIVDLSKRHGGVDVRVVDVARFLKDQGEILVVVLKGSPVAELLSQAGVAIHAIPRRRHDPRIAIDIARLAREFHADVIDAHNPQSQLWGSIAAKLSRVQTSIATVHTIYREAHRGFMRQRAHEAVLLLCRALGLKFIAVSKSIENYLVRLGVAPDRITLSYNGVPASPGEIRSANIRGSLGISASQFLVGMMGRVQKVKGYDVLIQAIAKLRERGCLVHVLIVGEGTDEDDMRRLIHETELDSQIHYLGYRKDVASLMPELDALCIPSRSEGLPYTALEAARTQLAIVASSTDGLKEVFVDHETALLVPPNDVDALAHAIEELALDRRLRFRLGKAARALILQRFTIRTMVSKTLAVYSMGR